MPRIAAHRHCSRPCPALPTARIARHRAQQINAKDAQDFAGERIARARADGDRIFDRRARVAHARHVLHAQDRALVEASADAEHLQVDFVRDRC